MGRDLLPAINAKSAAGSASERAIEIANALLEEGYDEGEAIRIAIAKAKEWAEDRGWSR
jgi:uncharacterized protein YdaT